VHTELVSRPYVPLFARGGQHDYGNQPAGGARLDLLQDLEPVHFWQFQIQQHQSWRTRRRPGAENSTAEQEVKSFLSIAGYLNPALEVVAFKRSQCELQIIRVVFDQQNLIRSEEHTSELQSRV